MGLNAFFGRIFDWHGCIGRLTLLKVALANLGIWLVLTIPYLVWIWFYFDIALDFGLSSADLYTADLLELGTFIAALIIWHWFMGVVIISMMYAWICAHCKRLNDMNASKWWIVLLWLPILSQILTLICLLVPHIEPKTTQIEPTYGALQQ